MKFSGNTASLGRSFALAAGIAPNIAGRPVLENALLAAGKEGLTLTVTDLEVGLQLSLGEVEIAGEGRVLVPAGKMSQILKECREEEVTFSAEGGKARLVAGRNTFELSAQEDPAGFPELRLEAEQPDLEVEAAVLKEMIRKTSFAAAREGLQYALHGLLVAAAGGQLELVALDGKKLARVSRPVKGTGKQARRALVPTRAMGQIEKLLGEEGKALLGFGEKRFLVRTGEAILAATVVDGRFPDYEQIVPAAWAHTVNVEAGELLAGVRRAAVLAERDTRMVECCFGEGKVVLTARDEGGQSRVEVDAEYGEAPLTVRFSSEVLAEVLRAAGAVKVAIRLGQDDAQFARFDAGPGTIYVVAPLRREES